MISKYKKVNIKTILLGTIIVVILGGLGVALNTSKSQAKTQINIANEFVKNFYEVDALKIADYEKMLKASANLTPGNKTAEDNYLKAVSSFDKNIQPLMTVTGYNSIIGNRYNTPTTLVCVKGNYTVQVTDIILEKNLYSEKEDKAGYHYEAKLKFTSTNGKDDRSDTAKGYIGLLKENSQWKVSIYKSEADPKLYKEIMMKTMKE
ncbi:hypothetical protein [Clostridium sp.]|uniref:hypothetical protein n=1 Tax=Clostridium sp. TaxID=1506 RepID=UPI001A5B8138|nr:hypothetical protein [Clostridium sp.]MBK5235860.1 hypothetical protein [Clostridium sp.]